MYMKTVENIFGKLARLQKNVKPVFVLCFVVHCLVSFLVLQSSGWGRESRLLYLVFLVSCDCCCSVALPQGSVG